MFFKIPALSFSLILLIALVHLMTKMKSRGQIKQRFWIEISLGFREKVMQSDCIRAYRSEITCSIPEYPEII
jgi:hypothetical protein